MKKRMLIHLPHGHIAESVEELEPQTLYLVTQAVLVREGYPRHAYTPCGECHEPTEYATAHRINHQFFCPSCGEAIEEDTERMLEEANEYASGYADHFIYHPEHGRPIY